jgi:WD40 repeat protein/transcriptional regulator with XRE-family HTH domain
MSEFCDLSYKYRRVCPPINEMSQQHRRKGFLASGQGVRYLAEKMLEKDYTQESLAEKIGVSSDTVKRLLNPNWKINVGRKVVEKIAKVLDLQPTDIVDSDEWYPLAVIDKAQAASKETENTQHFDRVAVPPCPYRGLSAFREQDAECFFGREAFVEELVLAVKRQSLIAVIGRSGEGKSSVVFAGLIPQLRKEEAWVIADFSPKNSPFYNLAKSLIPLLEPETSKIDRLNEIRKQAEAFRQNNLMLQDIVENILENSSAQRLLLIVDQFEELYTNCKIDEEQQQFLDQLLATVRASQQLRKPNFTLVITLRSDFLGQVLRHHSFVDALQHNVKLLGSMTPDELREVIEKPAHKFDVKLQDGLTDIILRAVSSEPGRLPLLEFALKLLWDKQNEGKLTYIAYKEIGGVEEALAKHAENVYEELNENEKERVQHIFTQLVRPGQGTEDTRRLATRTEVREENWELVAYLANQDARLVVSGRDEANGEPTVEIVHESLIKGWERLRLWMEVDREFRVWQERVRFREKLWKTRCEDEDELLRGAPLIEAEIWLNERPRDITEDEKLFINTSRYTQEREKKKEIDLRRQKDISGINELISLSQAHLLLHNQLDALLVSVKAGKQLQEVDLPSDALKHRTINTLQQAIYTIQELNRLEGGNERVSSVCFSPNGKNLASASADGAVRIWLVDGTLVLTFIAHKSKINKLCFSQDGQILATASDDKTAKLWQLDGTLIQTFKGHSDGVNRLCFSPDGQMLATASDDKTAKLWHINGILEKTFQGHSSWVSDVNFNHNGQMLATASADNTLKLWKLDGTLIQTFKGHSDRVRELNFSPDGQTIASASADNTLKLWKLDGTLIQTFEGHTHRVNSVNFSSNGQMLVSAADDNTVRVWKLSGILIQTFEGHTDWVCSACFSPNGEIIASAGDDKTVRLWKIDSRLLKVFQGHNDWVCSACFSPNGKTIASASRDNTIKLWKLNEKLVKTLSEHSDKVWDVCL